MMMIVQQGEPFMETKETGNGSPNEKRDDGTVLDAPQGREERYFPITEWGVREPNTGRVHPHAVLVEINGKERLVPGHVLADVHTRRDNDGTMSVHGRVDPPWGSKNTEVRIVGSRTLNQERAQHLATLAMENIKRCKDVKERHKRARRHTRNSYLRETAPVLLKTVTGGAICVGAIMLGGGLTPLLAIGAGGYAAWQILKVAVTAVRWKNQMNEIDESFGTKAPVKGEAQMQNRSRTQGKAQETEQPKWVDMGQYARWTPPAKQQHGTQNEKTHNTARTR